MAEQEKEAEIRRLRERLAELEQDSSPDRELPRAAPQGAKSKAGTFIGAAVVAGVVILMLSYCVGQTPTDTAASGTAASDLEPVEIVEPARETWHYSTVVDEMTDSPTHTACTTSTNEVRLDWPYSDVTADLCVRQSPRHGLDVFVVLNGQGQIICRSYRDCSVKVRFGQQEASNFPAVDAADGSSNIIFFNRTQRFVTGLKSAEETRIELTLYEAGVQTVVFDTKGLEWPRPPAT